MLTDCELFIHDRSKLAWAGDCLVFVPAGYTAHQHDRTQRYRYGGGIPFAASGDQGSLYLRLTITFVVYEGEGTGFYFTKGVFENLNGKGRIW